MALFVSMALFGLLATVIAAYGYGRFAKPAHFLQRLRRDRGALPSIERISPSKPSRLTRQVQALGQRAPISKQDALSARRMLMAAGHRTDGAVALFFGLKILLAAALGLTALLVRGSLTANPVLRIVAPLAAAALGYWLPSFLLERRITRRHRKIRESLPDALDLLVVSVEAGLGLDQALQNVSRELALVHPVLSEELGLVTLEMRAGKRRAEALRNLAERTREAELRKLTAVLVQSDRFGTSMSEALRTHSEFMRVRRRHEAEERAGKVGVKLVFPIFFFILPSILVVAAGPGLLQVFKYLFPLLKGVQ
jgi:tight adherence protein C